MPPDREVLVIHRTDDHETRIRRLERALWIAAGASAAGGGIVGAIIRQAIAG